MKRATRIPGGQAAHDGRKRCITCMALAAASLQACAIHYYDGATQTEHIWGFGHMAMKVSEPREGVRAIVRGVDTLGIGVGSISGQSYVIAGWQSVRRLEVVGERTQARLEWPNSDFFAIRVGNQPPHGIAEQAVDPSREGEEKKETPP